MNKPKTTIFSGNPVLLDLIKDKLPDADISVYPPVWSDGLSDEAVRCLAETEVLYGFHNGPKDIISKCPKLKWIQYEMAGVDGILKAFRDVPQKVKANITITRDGDSFVRPIAEYVIGQILAITNRQYQWYEQQQERVYKRDFASIKPTYCSSVAILGLGRIGTEVARICKCLGMKVWAMTRNTVPDERKCPYADEYRTTSGLSEMLSECDYIVNILPSTEETRGLLLGDAFSHCKNKKAVFINVGRGDVTDEQSLIRALRNGWLQYAVLDVLNTEPLPADNPLWREPGVILTPHVAWGYNQHKYYLETRATTFVNQYHRYVNNDALKYVVDADNGY